MPRLRNLANGSIVNVDDELAANLIGFGPVEDEGGTVDYAAMKLPELKAEIARRNEGREEADKVPADGNKPDLIAALEADDEGAASTDD